MTAPLLDTTDRVAETGTESAPEASVPPAPLVPLAMLVPNPKLVI
jgi:hypothetical protein